MLVLTVCVTSFRNQMRPQLIQWLIKWQRHLLSPQLLLMNSQEQHHKRRLRLLQIFQLHVYFLQSSDEDVTKKVELFRRHSQRLSDVAVQAAQGTLDRKSNSIINNSVSCRDTKFFDCSCIYNTVLHLVILSHPHHSQISQFQSCNKVLPGVVLMGSWFYALL